MASHDARTGLYGVSRRDEDGSELADFTLDITPTGIHALVGEAGSGKGLVCRLFTGQTHPDAGEVLIRGRAVSRLKGGIDRHVRMIEQRETLVEDSTIMEHFVFAHFRQRGFWRGSRRTARRHTQDFLVRNRIELALGKKAGELEKSDKFFAQILIALYVEPGLVILNNSLQELRLQQKRTIISMLKEGSERGMSVLLVTPLLEEVLEYSDYLTIIKSGQCVFNESTRHLDRLAVLKASYRRAESGEADSLKQQVDIFQRHMQYYVSLLTSYPRPFLIVNMAREIELFNQAAREFLGLNNERYTTLYAFLEAYFPGNATNIEKRIYSEDQAIIPLLPTTLGESEITISLYSYKVREDGKIIGVVIMLDDVTEQVRLQEQMTLTEQVASLGILTAGMAHEINHPLATISNIVEYMKIKFRDPLLLEEIHNIEEETANIGAIIRNLLDFSDGGVREDVDMHALIRDTIRIIRHYADSADIELSVETTRDDFVVHADRVGMRQVLLNILSNSMQAIKESGRVAVSTHVDDSMGYIVISDDGCGMSKETLKRIFLPFYSRRSGKGGGMGLGLYLAYKIVKNYGGAIEVESKPGAGSVFVLRFHLKATQKMFCP